MKRVTNMTEGSPLKLILLFAIPLIFTNLGQQLYMIVDASIVGRGVGVKALAAVGSTDWSYWLILWTITGLTQGFGVFVSRYFGEKDYDKMNRSITMSTILCVVIGAVLTLIGVLAARPLLILLETPADILDGAVTYLTTMISGTLIVIAYNMAASILRAFGDGRSPLVAMLIAGLMNIGLDLLFVLVFHWGIFGAAIATVSAQFVSFLYCLVKISKIEYVSLAKANWVPDGKMIKELLLFGLPLALQYIVIAGSGMVMQSTINQHGSLFVAGYTASNKLYGLLESSAISLGFAFSTFFAQNYGAGNKQRVRNGVRTGVKLSILLALGVTVVMLLIGKYLLQAFINAGEAEGPVVLEIAQHYLLVMAAFLVVCYLIHVYRNALQAMGTSIWSMVSGFAECGVRILMAKGVVSLLGSEVLFYIEPFAWLGALLFIMIPYYIYRKKLLA
mgnify:FL=1